MSVKRSVAALPFYLSACSGVTSKQGREEQQRVESVYSGGEKASPALASSSSGARKKCNNRRQFTTLPNIPIHIVLPH